MGGLVSSCGATNTVIDCIRSTLTKLRCETIVASRGGLVHLPETGTEQVFMTQRYRSDKFRELVLLVAKRSESDPKFGEVELHKLLYFSDFLAFARWGEAITNARYQKNRYGPTARVLNHVVEEVEREEAVSVGSVDYHGHAQSRVVARRLPNERRPVD